MEFTYAIVAPILPMQEPDTVQRSDGLFLPMNHPEYVAWLTEGNTPTPLTGQASAQ